MLITAIWEAYCEDIVAEALTHLVKHAPSADALPKHIKKVIADELKAEKNDIAIWSLSDDNWRQFLKDRLSRLQEDRNRRLNTPKAENIRELFLRGLGIDDITDAWKWAKVSQKAACKKLDDYVTLRGQIAHRGSALKACHKSQVEDYFAHVKQLVPKTGGRVNTFVRNVTKKALW